MAGVTCKWCAIAYEVMPDRCPNCGCPEAADAPVPAAKPVLATGRVVTAPAPVLVGEDGPELKAPPKGGAVKPAKANRGKPARTSGEE